jgi:hypothetical protein
MVEREWVGREREREREREMGRRGKGEGGVNEILNCVCMRVFVCVIAVSGL